MIFMKNVSAVPAHIGIILDGNRRWAKGKGLTSFEGHRRGAENIKKILAHAQKIGVKFVSVYAFSTENWNRSKTEVNYLMGLFSNFIDTQLSELGKAGIKFRLMGSLDRLPSSLQKKLINAAEETANNKGLVFNMGINYGGRDEIVRAIKRIIDQGHAEITMDAISQNLDTAGIPDPDLIIRTSGEQRLSGFMTWQSVYSELYFTETYWPDFDEKELDKAIEEYQKRQRRFGN